MSQYDSEDEANLTRAIALSLEYVKQSNAKVVNLISDSDDDDLDKPVVKPSGALETCQTPGDGAQRHNSTHLAKQRHAGLSTSVAGSAPIKPKKPSLFEPPAPGDESFPGLDRKAMEAARLARANKRKAAVSPTTTLSKNDTQDSRSAKRPMLMDSESGDPSDNISDWDYMSSMQLENERARAALYPDARLSGPNHFILGLQPQRNTMPRKPVSTLDPLTFLQQKALLTSGIKFPNGAVKKTWAHGFPRENDIRIEEVLQCADLEFAVLSSFQWDEEWILKKIDLRKTRVICVVQARSETEKDNMRANVPSYIKLCFPSMVGQISCMHSKLMLLAHPGYLRIAIPSANLTPYDWGEAGGIMENSVFMIDLPRLPNRISADQLPPFGRELLYFLQAQGMDSNLVDSLLRFDFAKSAPLAFVHTIGGSHTGDAFKRTGYCGLGSAIRELGLATDAQVELHIVTASLGSIKMDFLNAMYLAAKGDWGRKEYSHRTNRLPKPRNGAAASGEKTDFELAEQSMWEEVDTNVQIYFPTRETVAKSKGGIGAGGTICFQRNWYDDADFPRHLLRNCRSVRTGLLMHNKMIFALHRFDAKDGNSKTPRGWAYVGSANLSESAWGRLVKDRTTKLPKLNCRNWECGVVIPVTAQGEGINVSETDDSRKARLGAAAGSSGRQGAAYASRGLGMFRGVVDIPMGLPGDEYGTQKPWFYNER